MDILLIFIGSFGISAAIAYSWWAKSRTVFFRQNLFAIRFALWKKAHASGALEDPVYIETRQRINAMIRSAEVFSVRTMAVVKKRPSPRFRPRETDSPIAKDCQAAFDSAIEKALIYTLFQKASGLLFLANVLFKLISRNSGKPARKVYHDSVASLKSDFWEQVSDHNIQFV